MKDAAKDNQVILLRCNLCKRGVTFLAADLLNIVDQDHPLHYPPMGCSKCGGTEFVDVRVESIRDRDYGRLIIRRITGKKTVYLWGDKVLGEK